MTNEQKGQVYNNLMIEFTRIQNRIASIKGESIDLNETQLRDVRELENKLRYIMESVSRL